MENLQLIERAVQNNSWAAFLFTGSFILVAVLKSVFAKQFNDFLGLAYNNKYIRLYNDGSFSLNWFSFFLVLIQLISFSFFFQITFGNLEILDKNQFYNFARIFIFLTSFISVKFLIERGIAYLFNIEVFYNNFLFQQMSYRIYLGLFLLFGTFIMFYSGSTVDVITYIFLSLFVIIHVIIYLISFRIFQKEIIGNLFYFILYLCTLEIAPYYFTYYWFTKH